MTGEGKGQGARRCRQQCRPHAAAPPPPAARTPRGAPHAPAGLAAEISVWGLEVCLFVFRCSRGGFICKLEARLVQKRWV